MTGYRARLFAAYERRTTLLDADDAAREAWFEGYVATNYLPYLPPGRVLEIGCNKGFVLAVLARRGWHELVGIDLSPGDLDKARRYAPTANVIHIDAFDYLPAHAGEFDAIITKAVLEHVEKSKVLPFLQLVRDALRPSGVALIDVPNMDWLFAGHERYMDYTHEAGYTSESLRQVMESVFDEVDIRPIDTSEPYQHLGRRERASQMRIIRRRARTRTGRALLNVLFRLADPEGASLPIWDRSLLAVAIARQQR